MNLYLKKKKKLRLKHYLEKAHKFEVTSGSYIKHQMYINCELWSWKVNPLMPFFVFHCWSLALMASLQPHQWVDFLFFSSYNHVGFSLPASVNIQPCEKIVGKFKLRSRSAWVAWSIYPQWAGGHTCTGHHSISLMTLWAQFNSVCSRIKFWGLYLLGKCLTGVSIQLLIRNLGNGEAELHMKAFSSWREDRFRSQVWGKHTCDEWPSLGLSVKAMLLHFWVIWHFLQNQDELKQAKSRGDICSKCYLLWWGPFPFKTVGAPPQWSKDANYL